MSSATQTFIPLSVPEIRGREWEYVKDCLDTGWVSSVGSYVNKFEEMMAEATGAPHAVAVMNGTNALHIALLLAGVKPGEAVLCSDITFIASANAIRYAFAEPVFIDCDPETWQMDPLLVRDYLENRCERRPEGVFDLATGRRVAAVMPVHILGHPVDLHPIQRAAEEFGIPVVEDAAEALGTEYKGRRIGSHSSFAACFSFNGNKILTTGGGGCLVTDDPEVARRAKHLTTQAKDDPWEYIHSETGFNYRMVNILAAIGCAQLELLDEYIGIKREIARRYTEALAEIPGLEPLPASPLGASTYWLYTIRVKPLVYGRDSRRLMRDLQDRGIQSRPLWEPMHMSRAQAGAEFVGSGVSESLYREALSLPCSVGLTLDDQIRVLDALRELNQPA
jgi:perosamine synthetase